MLVRDKQQLTANIKLKNKHEADALASAILACNRIRPILIKIKKFIRKNQVEKYEQEMTERTLRGENILEILHSLKPAVSRKTKAVVIHNPEDTVKSLIKRQEREIKQLHRKNNKLQSQLKKIQKRDNYLLNELVGIKNDDELKTLVQYKEKNIHGLIRELRRKDERIAEKDSKITKLYHFFSLLHSYRLVKKLKNLGSELENLQSLLNITHKDIILVDNPNEISQNTIDFLEGKVSVIIHKKLVSNKIQRLPFIFISASKLTLIEEKHFALVNKKELTASIDHKLMLKKIVTDYQEKRLHS